VAVAFAVAGDCDCFETGVEGEVGEERGVAFADCEACVERGDRSGRVQVAGEEGVAVVGDVVVEPGEDGAGFVRKIGKGCSEIVSELLEGRYGLPREEGRVSIGRGEVATKQTVFPGEVWLDGMM